MGEGRRGVVAVVVWLAAAVPVGAGAQTAPEPPPPAPPSATGDASLTGAAAWDRLKGNTITGKIAGQPFSEYFEPGGGVRYADKDGLSTGTWALQGKKVCFDFPEDDDRSCSVFTVTGATGTAVDDDGTVARFDISPGNSKGL